MIDEKQIVLQRYEDCKTERQKNIKLWKDVNKYVAIASDIASEFEDSVDESKQRDKYINDPTAYIATTQLTDYLVGLIWGTGEDVLALEPNDYILNQVSNSDELNEFYRHATAVTLREFNHEEAGFLGALTSFIQGQVNYGTSGAGCYPSKEYIEGQAENILQFNNYGVYNSCFDEGKNGKISVVYSVRHWRLARIIDEFAVKEEGIDEELFNKLPKEIKDAYDKKEYNKKFKIIHGILPHKDYSVGKIGKKGTKYKGFWFTEESKKIFFEEYYREMPAAVCRSIRIANKIYGASFATLAITSIKLLNYIAGKAIRNAEKMTDRPKGYFSGSLPAGEIIDTSADGLTPFKDQSDGKPPIFDIDEVGDISALVNILIPKAEKDISTIFKIDRLLDFNAEVAMTATESMQRFNIKSKSEIGIIIQILHEFLLPILYRGISVLEEAEAFGVRYDSPDAQELILKGKQKFVVPEVVQNAIDNNKRWYKIKFRNSINQIINAEKFEWLSNFILLFAQLLNLDPVLSEAVKSYNLLAFAKQILNFGNEDFMKSKADFEDAVKKIQEQQETMMKLQAENLGSNTVKNIAGAEKDAKQSRESKRLNR